MTICLDCGEMNKTHERHCQSCGQRLVRRIYWDAAIVQQSSSSELPCDDLPVQDWPFEAHAIELRRQLQPTIKLVMAVARQLLQQNSGS